MRSVTATAGAVDSMIASSGDTKCSGSSVYQPSAAARCCSPTWNVGVTPCSANAAHMRSWSGCDSGFPSTGRAPIIAMRTSAAPNAATCASNHAGSRSVRCATGCSRPFPSARTTAHHRFHAPMLAVSAGNDVDSARSHSSPKFGNSTASSSPIVSRRATRADGSQ